MSSTRPATNSAPPTSIVLVRLAFAVRELCMNTARPRVDVAEGEVDGGVHRDVDDRDDQHCALHHRVVDLVGGGAHHRAHHGQGEESEERRGGEAWVRKWSFGGWPVR